MHRLRDALRFPAVMLGGLVILVGFYWASRWDYLLFHALVEMFSIIVACSIFLFAWNSRRFRLTRGNG